VRRWLSNYQELKEAIEAVCELTVIMICCARNAPYQRHAGSRMIEMQRTHLNFGDGLIAEEVSDLRDGWMKHADTVKQSQARIFGGNARSEGKLLSPFEPSTEVIQKGKAGRPNEFGKMMNLQEAENQIITDYENCAPRKISRNICRGMAISAIWKRIAGSWRKPCRNAGVPGSLRAPA
jgi:hypothetical protein